MIARPNPLWLLLVALTGCGKVADRLFCGSGGCGWRPGEWERVASLANPGDPPFDLSNGIRDDSTAIAMGQQFFFDPAFSGNATQQDAIKRSSPPARAAKDQPIGISCATCHDLRRAGVDTTSVPGHVSIGAGWTDVNALPVVNSAYRQLVFWNGRADSLWALNVAVAESATTMNGNRLRTAHLIYDRYGTAPFFLPQIQKFLPSLGCNDLNALWASIPTMPSDGKPGAIAGCQPDDKSEPFGDAYDCTLSVDQQTLVTTLLVIWAKAIAAYERLLSTGKSEFDRFVQAGPSSDATPAGATRGARLFVGKAACIDCHAGPQLTDEQFHDIGIPQTGVAVPTTADCPAGASCDCDAGTGCLPWGFYEGLRRLKGAPAKPNPWLRTGRWSDYPGDVSRQAYVDRQVEPALKGQWRTPSLRNVALTAPYMHDGRYATLQDVVWHYNTGGQNAGPEQIGDRAPEIKPLRLTDGEQADLVAFLESLTGDPPPAKWTTPPDLPPAGAAGSSTLQRCSGPPPGGTGGAAGAGGAGGAGGTTGGRATGFGGSGGIGGRGGAGGVPPFGSCGTPSAIMSITSFSDAVSGDPIRFGITPTTGGQAFSTSTAGPPPALSVLVDAGGNRALQAMSPPQLDASTGTVDFGLRFDTPLDVSGYNTIQFTSNANCPLAFGLRSTRAPDAGPGSTCTSAACLQSVMPVPRNGTVCIRLPPPGVFDLTSISEMFWEAPVVCGLNATVDDVALVRQ